MAKMSTIEELASIHWERINKLPPAKKTTRRRAPKYYSVMNRHGVVTSLTTPLRAFIRAAKVAKATGIPARVWSSATHRWLAHFTPTGERIEWPAAPRSCNTIGAVEEWEKSIGFVRPEL